MALTAPDELVSAAQAEIDAEEGPARPDARRMFRAVTVNGDGIPDWRVDWEKAGFSTWCGTGGCRQQLYVSRSDRSWLLAFDEQTRQLKVKPSGSTSRLDIDLHGSSCGSFGAAPCPRSFLWDDGSQSWVPSAAPNGSTRLYGPMFQPVSPTPRQIVTLAAEVVAEQKARCGAAGAELAVESAASAVRSPDLNGDGQHDWIVGSPYSFCRGFGAPSPGESAAPVSPGLVVLVSGPNGFTRGLETERTGYLVDIATNPATFISILESDGCRGVGRCSEQPHVWDATLGRLAPRPPASRR